jgi:hypothetical protein
MVTMNLGCMSESCFHFLHLTHAGTRTVDGKNGFQKMSLRLQVDDEFSIRFILPLEHTEMFFNVLLKLRMARSRTQYTGQ